MSRSLMLALLAGGLLAFAVQPRAQVLNLTPRCDEFGALAWGQLPPGASSPVAVKSNCDGTVPLPAISNVTDGANQAAAFSTGRGVAFKGSVNWSAANPLAITFPPVEVLAVRVWVLHINKTVGPCDISCVRNNMSEFLIWANERLNAERTGIQLKAFEGDPHWVSDETSRATSSPVKELLDFTESGSDCAIVSGTTFPSIIRKEDTLNLYIIRTEKGLKHRGVYCRDARDRGFANAFVASRATNSTILHELSHNLGLGHFPGALNVMNQDIQDGAFFTEGQSFRMNFSAQSALTIFGVHESDKRDCSLGPIAACPAEGKWIWPDP